MYCRLNKKISTISGSLTAVMSSKASLLKLSGYDVISFAIGEPKCEVLELVKIAGIYAINNNNNGYTAVDGIIPLKNIIIIKNHNNNLSL